MASKLSSLFYLPPLKTKGGGGGVPATLFTFFLLSFTPPASHTFIHRPFYLHAILALLSTPFTLSNKQHLASNLIQAHSMI